VKNDAKRIALLVAVGVAFVGAIILIVVRRAQFAGMLRAAAQGALIKHDLVELMTEREEVEKDAQSSAIVREAIDIMIAAKERELVEVPLRLKGFDDAAIDHELRLRGMLK
jgi:hypothetical protein